MARYRYLAADLLTGAIREEIPFTSSTYSETLNRPGALNADLPLTMKRTRSVAIPYAREVLALEPTAYYRLGERSGNTATDLTGNFDATYNGAPHLYQTGAISGDVNRSTAFGADNTTYGELVVPVGAGDFEAISFSVAAWINVEDFSSATIFHSRVGTGAGQQAIVNVTTNGAVEFYCDSTDRCVTADGAITLNEWAFVVATFDHDSSTQTIYVNGVEAATNSAAGYTGNTPTTVTFGGVFFGLLLANFMGRLDEATIWRDRVVTAEEVSILYATATGSPRTTSVTTQIASRANLDPGSTALYVERDGIIRWGGILWTARYQGGRLSFGAEGFWSYFRRRVIRHTQAFAAQEQLAIARDLVSYAQEQAGGDILVLTGAETSGVTRDRLYTYYERKNIGEAVEQLAAVENGFDFAVECEWDGDEITRNLRLYYPGRGRLTNLVFEEGVNVGEIEWQIDATAQANVIDGMGSGEGDAKLIATAADTSVLNSYPILEDEISLQDVSVSATLQEHANAALAARRLPVETFPKVVVKSGPGSGVGLGTWIVGDQVRIRADHGYLDVDAIARIVGSSVAVGRNGEEVVSVIFSGTEA